MMLLYRAHKTPLEATCTARVKDGSPSSPSLHALTDGQIYGTDPSAPQSQLYCESDECSE